MANEHTHTQEGSKPRTSSMGHDAVMNSMGDGEGMDMEEQERKMQQGGNEHDAEDASEGNGGYTFETPEHKEQLKAQRQQLWQCASSCCAILCSFVEGAVTRVCMYSSLTHPFAHTPLPDCLTPPHLALPAGLKHVGANMFKEGEAQGMQKESVRV